MKEPQEVRSDADLRPLEWCQKEARLPIDLFSNEVLVLTFKLNGLLDNTHRDF